MAEVVTESNIPELVSLAKAWVETELLPRTEWVKSEVAVAINWSTGDAKILDVTERSYPDLPGYQFGTADLVAVLKDGSLWVADWKTGGTDAAEAQLLSLACGLRRVFTQTVYLESTAMDFTYEVSRPVRICCLKVDEKGVWPEERAVSEEELSNHWDAMQWAWEAIGKRTEKVPGIHCTQLYCPHLAHCEAVTGLIQDAADKDPEIIPASRLSRKYRMTDKPRDDFEAGYVAERVTAAKRQLNYYYECLKAYCRAGGRVVSGQYEWSEKNDGFRWRKMK